MSTQWSKKDKDETGNLQPTRVLTISVVFTLVLFAMVGWSVWDI